eukprot:scaffold53328_cov74-Phaeocystis_antarctica.AAC.3
MPIRPHSAPRTLLSKQKAQHDDPIPPPAPGARVLCRCARVLAGSTPPEGRWKDTRPRPDPYQDCLD